MLESQLSLLDEVKESFDVPIVVAYSKSDMHNMRDLPAFSNVTGEGIDEIVKLLKNTLKTLKEKEREEVTGDSTSVEEG
jgi:nucleolar GTP-binding protein